MRETEILGRIWCCKQRAYGLTITYCCARAETSCTHPSQLDRAGVCQRFTKCATMTKGVEESAYLEKMYIVLVCSNGKYLIRYSQYYSLWYNGAHFRTTAAMKLVAAGILTCFRTLVQKVPSFTDGRRRLNEKQSFITAPTLQRSA